MIPNSFIGLRFVLKDTSFVNALVTMQEAEKVVKIFMTDTGRDNIIFGCSANPPPGGGLWAVKGCEIMALHTFDPNQQMQQPLVGPPPQGTQYRPGGPYSGRQQ